MPDAETAWFPARAILHTYLEVGGGDILAAVGVISPTGGRPSGNSEALRKLVTMARGLALKLCRGAHELATATCASWR